MSRMALMDLASHIRIVLVETSHPGNIGAVARAMKTMTLERLYLVKPAHFPHPDATARATGADELLDRAVVCDTLDQALADTTLVLGASARLRTVHWPQLNPRECAQHMLSESQRGEVALVFGRERSGLSNVELDRCHYLTHIPCNPDYRSLNLAAAVQVLCYELMVSAAAGAATAAHNDAELRATADETEQFFEHLQHTLSELEFLDPDNPRHLMRRLRRLFHRARMSRNEVNILRGVLTAALQRRRKT